MTITTVTKAIILFSPHLYCFLVTRNSNNQASKTNTKQKIGGVTIYSLGTPNAWQPPSMHSKARLTLPGGETRKAVSLYLQREIQTPVRQGSTKFGPHKPYRLPPATARSPVAGPPGLLSCPDLGSSQHFCSGSSFLTPLYLLTTHHPERPQGRSNATFHITPPPVALTDAT